MEEGNVGCVSVETWIVVEIWFCFVIVDLWLSVVTTGDGMVSVEWEDFFFFFFFFFFIVSDVEEVKKDSEDIEIHSESVEEEEKMWIGVEDKGDSVLVVSELVSL